MILKNVLKDIDFVADEKLLGEDVKGIEIDSRKVKSGDVFVALVGEKSDGNQFISQALTSGAVAVVTDSKNVKGKNIVYVSSARKAYSVMCKNFFDRCCDKLKIVAVTGTNGKTTTTSLIAEILRYNNIKTGLIGTLGAGEDKDSLVDTGFTTPDPFILHKLFKQMYDDGCKWVIMEASAHALILDKLEGITFEMGVLTNITEDHLDYFCDMQTYANAKMKLFESGRVKLGIICGDDNLSVEKSTLSQVPTIFYGTKDFNDVKASNIKSTFEGSSFDCNYLGKTQKIETSLVGNYNIQNALASIAVTRSLGLDENQVYRGVKTLNMVEGRFNVIKINTGKKQTNVVIDYAHTPDGLENVLKTAKSLSNAPLVVVFGCGGNRDKLKRPIMGEIASKYADYVVLTSDNPRYENPLDIIGQIKQGVKGECEVIENRSQAIRETINKFDDGQTIVIAGKGAEKYQEIKGEKVPFNDFNEVQKAVFEKTKKQFDHSNDFDFLTKNLEK